MADNTVVVLSKEFMTRIKIALGEIQAKFAIPVIAELEAWETKVAQAPHEVLAAIESHIAPIKAKVAAGTMAAVDAAAVAALKVEAPVVAVEAEVTKVDAAAEAVKAAL
jgi:hypothetical protein